MNEPGSGTQTGRAMKPWVPDESPYPPATIPGVVYRLSPRARASWNMYCRVSTAAVRKAVYALEEHSIEPDHLAPIVYAGEIQDREFTKFTGAVYEALVLRKRSTLFTLLARLF